MKVRRTKVKSRKSNRKKKAAGTMQEEPKEETRMN